MKNVDYFKNILFELPEWFSLNLYDRYKNMEVDEWHAEISARKNCTININWEINSIIKKITGNQSGYSRNELLNEEDYELTKEDSKNLFDAGDITEDEFNEDIRDFEIEEKRQEEAEKRKKDGIKEWEHNLKCMILSKKNIPINNSETTRKRNNSALRPTDIEDIFVTSKTLNYYNDVKKVFDDYEPIKSYSDDPFIVHLTHPLVNAYKETDQESNSFLENIEKCISNPEGVEAKQNEQWLKHRKNEQESLSELLEIPISEVLGMAYADMVTVDFTYSDDVILKQFKEWLKKRRKDYVMDSHKTYVKNHIRDSGVSLKTQPNKDNVAYWHKNKVLPYIDLKALMLFFGLAQLRELHDAYREGLITDVEIEDTVNNILKNINKPRHPFFANILFPQNSLDVQGDKDTVRRDIAPLANILLTSYVGTALFRE